MDEVTFTSSKYIPSKEAAKIAGYSSDYISRLCRTGRLNGYLAGRAWFVERASLQTLLIREPSAKPSYYDEAARRLGDNLAPFRYENDNGPVLDPLVEKPLGAPVSSAAGDECCLSEVSIPNEHPRVAVRWWLLPAGVLASAAFFSALFITSFDEYPTAVSASQSTQLALTTPFGNFPVSVPRLPSLAHQVVAVGTTVARAASSNLRDFSASTSLAFDQMRSSLAAAVGVKQLSSAPQSGWDLIYCGVFTLLGFEPCFSTVDQSDSPASGIASNNTPLAVTAATSTTPNRQPVTYVTQPVIERIVDKAVPMQAIAVAGVSEDLLNAKLEQLANSLKQQIYGSSAAPSNNFTTVSSAIALSNKIDTLSGVTISNSTISGGLTGLTNADIPNDITASNYLALLGGTLSGAVDNTSTATSSFLGGFSASVFNASSTTATSTFANGLDLTGGCFSVDNVCLTANAAAFAWAPTTFGSTAANSTSTLIGFSSGFYSLASSTVTSLTTVNATATNATTTNLAVSGTASTSALVASNAFTFSTVSGFLKATAGAVATALIDLANDVTGVLGVGNGGTGWAAIESGSIPYGNGSSALATTSAGTPGQVLALLSGVPTWTSTTTFSGGLTYAGGNVTNSGVTSLTAGSGISLSGSTGDITVTNSIGYPFPFDATTTKLTFSGGLLSLASTTIGAGGQTTGLTISGGATTTGNLYVAGSAGFGTNDPAGSGGTYVFQGTQDSPFITKIYNASAGNSATARLDYATGIANTYAVTGINNNSGNPYFITSVGSGVTGGTYYDSPYHIFRSQAGSEYARFTSTGIGIGTTDPLDKLSVSASGSGTTGGVLSVANSAAAAVGNASVVGFRSASQFGTTYYSGKISSIVTNASTYLSDLAFNTYDASGPNGREVLRLTSSGNVGIGTTSPGAPLALASTALNSIMVTNSSGSAEWLNFGDTSGNILGRVYRTSNDFALQSWTGGGNLLLNPTSGNVGIGTTTPGTVATSTTANPLLSVHGNLSLSGARSKLFFNGDGGDGQQSGLQFAPLDYGQTLTITPTDYLGNVIDSTIRFGGLGNYNSNSVNLAVSGNVGIGTASPAAKLDVLGDARIKGSSTNANLYLEYADGSQSWLVASNPYFSIWDATNGKGPFTIQSNTPSNTLYLTSSGYVGIGTTTPPVPFSVSTSQDFGTARFSSTGAEANIGLWSHSSNGRLYSIVSGGSGGAFSGGSFGIYDNTAAAVRLSIDSSGNVTVYGTASKPGGGSWSDSSDARLKTNIESIKGDDALAKLNALDPVTFAWINPALHGNMQAPGGFIAQDLQKVFPDFISTSTCRGADCALVSDTASTTYAINLPFKFEAYLVAAIQGLSQKLVALTEAVAKLAEKVSGLAESFTTRRLCIADEAGEQTCVTKSQLDRLLAGAAAGSSARSGGSAPEESEVSTTPDSEPPVITLNGNNPATIDVGATYSDLGALVEDNVDHNLGYIVTRDGVEISIDQISIDTSVAGEHLIEYRAEDQAGNVGTTSRTVIIGSGSSPDATAPSAESGTTTPVENAGAAGGQ